MTVSFGIYEDLDDLQEWFIRCVDGEVRDDYRRNYIDDNGIRIEVKNEVRRHNASCGVCSRTEQGAELEISSTIDNISDEELDDVTSRAVLEALGLPVKKIGNLFGCIDAVDMQARLILALSFIEPDGERIDYRLSNKQLLKHLNRIYDITDSAVQLRREIVWMEYPAGF